MWVLDRQKPVNWGGAALTGSWVSKIITSLWRSFSRAVGFLWLRLFPYSQRVQIMVEDVGTHPKCSVLPEAEKSAEGLKLKNCAAYKLNKWN